MYHIKGLNVFNVMDNTIVIQYCSAKPKGSICLLPIGFLVDTKHLCNIYTMAEQWQRHRADVV